MDEEHVVPLDFEHLQRDAGVQQIVALLRAEQCAGVVVSDAHARGFARRAARLQAVSELA